MKSERAKKIILGVLVLVAVYIWWGNLHLFVGTESNEPFRNEGSKERIVNNTDGPPLKYMDPRTNPFRNSLAARSEVSQQVQKPVPNIPPPSIDPGLTLTGVLRRGSTSQVVVASKSGTTEVLTVGDSLGPWVLTGIYENYAVFRQGKTQDTLWLFNK